MTDNDFRFMEDALEQARKSEAEDDRVHPMVGAVVASGSVRLSMAHRGEIHGDHAEMIALEHRLPNTSVAGATVYTTLEPCTTRNHPHVPCAEWLIQRKVSRVVIGMLDPNQTITGKGIRRLREANITVDLFPPSFMAQAEEMNRLFTRSQVGTSVIGAVTTGREAIVESMAKLCRTARKNIRLLVHALGPDYKLPDEFAHNIARLIRVREDEGTPVRFWPLIVVEPQVKEKLMQSLSKRANVYAEHGVSQFAVPRFLETDVPLAIDVLIIDNAKALVAFTSAIRSTQTQISVSFDQHPELISEPVDWFEYVAKQHSRSFEEFTAH